jgi:hypothetical protein
MVSGTICGQFPSGVYTTLRACAVDRAGNVSKGKAVAFIP